MDQLASQIVPILLFTTAVGGAIAWSQGLCTKKKIKSLKKTSSTRDDDVDEFLTTSSKKKQKAETKKPQEPEKSRPKAKEVLQPTAVQPEQPAKSKGKGKKKVIIEESASDDDNDDDEEDRLFSTFLSADGLKELEKLKKKQARVQPESKADQAKAKREAAKAQQQKKAEEAAQREKKRIADLHFSDDPTWTSSKAKKGSSGNDQSGDGSQRQPKKAEPPKKITISVPIQFEKRFIVIGKGGETLKAIRAKTNTWITVPTEEGRKVDFVKQYNNAPEYIKIEGFPNECEAAKQIINDLINKGYSRDLDAGMGEITVTVPVPQRGVLVGEKGSTLHKIQEHFNVKVVMPERTSMSEIVTVVGPRSSLGGVKAVIKSLLKNGYSLLTHPDYIKRVMKFDASYRKNLIGVAGSVIKQLQSRTNCRISFPDDMNEHKVIIVGSRDNVADAAKFIQKLQDELDASEEEYVDEAIGDDDEDIYGDDEDGEIASYYTRPAPWAAD